MALAGGIGFGPILAFKEVSDFIQIGLIAYQQKRKFSGSRRTSTGEVAIDGGMVTVRHKGQTFKVPIHDAAAAAGVAGLEAGAARPAEQATSSWEKALKYGAYATVPGVALGLTGALGLQRAKVGGEVQAASKAPSRDEERLDLRRWAMLQQDLQERTIRAQSEARLELEALRQRGARDLAALDAAIEREKVAATRDVARMQVVGALQRQREEYAARMAMQEAELSARAAESEKERAAAAARLEAKIRAERELQQELLAWKGQQAQLDREWRERVTEEQAQRNWQRQEWARSNALNRAEEAAKRMVHILKWSGLKSYGGVVEFAKAFAR